MTKSVAASGSTGSGRLARAGAGRGARSRLVGAGGETEAAGAPPGALSVSRCGMVAFAGRPNAGKSTLLNCIVGQKASIVSNKPQTTRSESRAVVTHRDAQIVFVDTPGIHKPRTEFGRRLNAIARESLHAADVNCLVVDASAPLGSGDAFIACALRADSVFVLTKTDSVRPHVLLRQLAAAGELEFEAYFPVSGLTGEGVDALVDHLAARLPQSPPLYPADIVRDVPERVWIAELVREQLLAMTRDELHHCITTRVTDWERPLIRCEIIVQRESQKGIVIGRRGRVLKEVGSAVRASLPAGAHLELVVRVDKHWQRHSLADTAPPG